ncbi:hypothetical protein MIZ03_1104 [Rhodoferax lithotrophicus]|uniref:Uncharacterized protein n=1 Tax=Rhodoferax lithotrophicus TaxID=2798804 RepID=A0ABM7MJ18_9BURK|nr:hypothetical protein [Rhodoferax sp. MIZ03]BCO26224.1 hypothetical protein MIZ03_1104 [Rhodoferax sp. MIZ03]
MFFRYLGSALFTLISFSLALIFCYLGLAGNSSLLGKTPTTQNYLDALSLSAFVFAAPLLIGASCAPFIRVRPNSWLALLLVVLGAWADFSVGNSFLALLIFPYNAVATWFLAVSCLLVNRNIGALPVFVASAVLATNLVIDYSTFTDRQAEERARAFCLHISRGQSVEEILGNAKAEINNKKHLRWVQELGSMKDGNGTVDILYRGVNLDRDHFCHVKVLEGRAVEASYQQE